MNKTISKDSIIFIYKLILSGVVNIKSAANALGISRNTVKKYISLLKIVIISYPGRLADTEFILAECRELMQLRPAAKADKRYDQLQKMLGKIYANIQRQNANIGSEWRRYKQKYPSGYGHTQFSNLFTEWCNHNGVTKLTNRWNIASVPEEDIKILQHWRRCSNREKWEKAVIILEAFEGNAVLHIARKIERTPDKVKEWIQAYAERGMDGLKKKSRKKNEQAMQLMEEKKANLIKLLHESPKLHDINRASWSQLTLAQAYRTTYGHSISTSSISAYIKTAGFSFRKAKETLTSPDPNFKEKLANITRILSGLTPKQKFFSVDEFGPFAVKMKGGSSYVKKGEVKTYPQLQKSKGCIICTAALELSENQVTHFYSKKKNTDEMIKLLNLLLVKYQKHDKIFFSWDAASWHASKKLYRKIEEINSAAYRKRNKTPLVELAPLPSSAQFLNVIESVFSGLAKAVIHNSNYSSAEECMEAIDRYFEERNEHFRRNPKRAGKKIWGKELVAPVFAETNNCKNPRWR